MPNCIWKHAFGRASFAALAQDSISQPRIAPLTCKSTRLFLLIPALLLITTQQARAKPLSSEECTKLVAEHAELSKKDVESLMDQDPVIAAKQMKPEQLSDIERFLFIEGQIRFRCPAVKLAVPDPPAFDPPEDQSKTAESEDKQPAGPTVPLPERKPARSAKRAG